MIKEVGRGGGQELVKLNVVTTPIFKRHGFLFSRSVLNPVGLCSERRVETKGSVKFHWSCGLVLIEVFISLLSVFYSE